MKTGKLWPTAFAPGHPGHPAEVLVSELKGMSLQNRVLAFKARMDCYFKEQVGRLAAPGVDAHFPLVVMTCVGIETLGAYEYGDLGRIKQRQRASRGVKDRHFQWFVEDMDVDFKEDAPDPDGTHRPLSDFLHEGFRHSLVHGFYGKWVFITANQAEAADWYYDPAQMSLVVNVFWLFRRFSEVYDDYFGALLGCSDPTRDPLKTFSQTFTKYFARWL